MYAQIFNEIRANICIKAMHRIINTIEIKGFRPNPTFTSSTALFYLGILGLSFLVSFYQLKKKIENKFT